MGWLELTAGAESGTERPRGRSVPHAPHHGSEVDDDFALGVAVPHVLDGRGGLAQRVGPVDDRPDLAGLDELGEREQVWRVLRADQRGQRLAGERGEEQRPDLTVAACEPSSVGLAPDDDQRPAGIQDRAEVLQRTVAPNVEDYVVAAPS